MKTNPLIWIVIGVSGSGKTTVGRLLSQQLDSDFLEGDRRHPVANIIKMSSQQPLADEDRRSWLLAIEADIKRAIEQNRETVITCSALKASYRKQLMSLGQVQLVWIDVNIPILQRRLSNRSNHFMTNQMLVSQLAAFEQIQAAENIITVDGNLSIDAVMNELMVIVVQRFPDLATSWWERLQATEL
jgi:gluconokinase